MSLRRKVSQFGRRFGLSITFAKSSEEMNHYRENLERCIRKYEFLMRLQSNPKFEKAIDACNYSQSQLGADIFVLDFLNFKEGGFFIECGAGDGFHLSNTLLLEKRFGWEGILVEPNKHFHSTIKNGREALFEERLLSSESGHLVEFSELEVGELSGVTKNLGGDSKYEKSRYLVESISLKDLLLLHHAPAVIDYFSLDVEGHEYEILKNFDFSAFRFRVISIEHNFSESRALIYDLLVSNGYKRVFENLTSFDDFYIDAEMSL